VAWLVLMGGAAGGKVNFARCFSDKAHFGGDFYRDGRHVNGNPTRNTMVSAMYSVDILAIKDEGGQQHNCCPVLQVFKMHVLRPQSAG